MFIRVNKTTNKKTGTEYITHRLVEAYKIGERNLQRVIMHLGKLDVPKSQWRHLAAILESRLSAQTTLVEDESELSELADRLMKRHNFVADERVERQERNNAANIVAVDINSIATTDSRSLGPELVGNSFWEKLKFDRILSSCGLDEQELSLAKAVILGRLISPGSDYNTFSWLQHRSALLEMTPVSLDGLGKDSFYTIADTLYEHKEFIERELRNQESGLFAFTDTLILYDLTNTYFEGSARGNSLAKRGKCKSKRSDCPLVTLALAVNSLGFPVFSQIYGGNQSEPETLEDILNRLQQDKQGILPGMLPTILMDRGIATKSNIKLLQAGGYSYTIIERRPVEKEYELEFQTAKENFEKLDCSDQDQQNRGKAIYVKRIELEETSRVLVFSEGREQKEQAMDALKEGRFLTDLGRLNTSVVNGNIILSDKVGERIGKIKTKYSSIQRHYDIQLVYSEDTKKIERISWEKKPSREQRSVLTGCYVIETTHNQLSASEIWHQYMTLTRVESAFRDLKTDLGLRPVYHQNAERTKAHLFIGVLAYHLLIGIEHTLKAQGDTREWRTIRKILSTHQRTTVIMTDAENMIYHIRVSGKPETAHAEIYKRLSVKNPLKQITRIIGARK
ncbi:MAG: IS1634 family transposase [Syntrophus sp. (in: bacteria)]